MNQMEHHYSTKGVFFVKKKTSILQHLLLLLTDAKSKMCWNPEQKLYSGSIMRITLKVHSHANRKKVRKGNGRALFSSYINCPAANLPTLSSLTCLSLCSPRARLQLTKGDNQAASVRTNEDSLLPKPPLLQNV